MIGDYTSKAKNIIFTVFEEDRLLETWKNKRFSPAII